ncbi:MAG: protein translocase subunit SecD [Bdellovibrionales bacterium]|nr:protein translocase subunit SecD [Bdellovibrionales bacterium]
MLSSLRSRWIVVILTLLLGAFWLSPNFMNYEKDSVLAKNKIIMGLDIQGGLHLVMGVDVESVIQERAARQSKDLSQQLKDDGIQIQGVQVVGDKKTEIEILTGGAANKAAVEKYLADRYASTFQVVQSSDDNILLQYFEATMMEMKKQVVGQAIEVIRNRIDEFGVAEPSISAQGSDRILVQLPGVKDALKAKELINRTARLDFRVVSQEVPGDKLVAMIEEAETKGNYKLGENDLHYAAYLKKLNADLESQLPKNTKVVFEKLESATSLEAGKRPYVVMLDSKLSGDQLEDAAVRPDEMGKPEVTFSFTVEGRKLFAELTARAAGGLIAIVLDDVIKSAPRVEREIDSDSARITLGNVRDYQAAQDEASFIATALRAGSLPAALEQLEERTVGPSLGADSIAKAGTAAMVGAIAVLLFMIFFYGVSGVVADIALAMNIFFTFAILTTLGATLTLPGVAGIALTVGMAVDANIIIFERIKEELRKGGTTALALKDGFSNAFSSIFDSNLTTVLTCVVLMYYGTGPIRGFAVTLMIGIISSMFTAVFVSRVILDTLVTKFNINILAQKKG